MAKYSEKWMKFVEDINNSLKLDPPFTMASEEQAIQDIRERQKTDDAFVDEDFVPQNSIGLRDSTVAWLIENDVPVPETWETRLKKQAEKAKKTKKDAEDMKKNDKVAEKKETKKEAKKPTNRKAPERAKNKLGHLIGSAAAELDDLFLAGVTEEQLEKKGFAIARYKSHFKHLEKDKADLVTVSWNKNKITAKMK